LFRIDFNPAYIVEGYGDGNYHEKCGLIENCHSCYYENLYNIYKRIAGRYPHLILQQAALGGGRNDLGVAAVFHENQLTDGLAIPRELQIYAGTTLELPPEYLRIFHGADGSHGNAKTHDFETIMRISYTLGPPSVFSGATAPSTETLSPKRRELFKRYADLYSNFIRPLLPDCLVYHHEPIDCFKGVEDSAWFCMEYGTPEKTKGWAVIARMFRDSGDRYIAPTHYPYERTDPYKKPQGEFDTSPVYIFYPRGLNVSKKYKVTLDSQRASFERGGFELTNSGIRLRLENAGMSELILLEEI